MVAMINPFDAGGYSLAEMTQAFDILPNGYTLLGQMGLFRFEGVTQRSVVIEQAEGVLNLLPTVPLGGPATVANRDTRSMRSFTVPWIPHDDVITPQDIQGVRGFGVADAADPLATVAGPPSGTVGKRLSTPSACSMTTERCVTPSKRNRPICPSRV